MGIIFKKDYNISMNKLLKIDYAYHTHTFRCGHAFGEDEGYVIEGIKNGFSFIGFADHGIFLTIKEEDGGREHKYFTNYIESILALKQKYAGTAEILLGGEFEYNEKFDWYYKELKEKYGYDYLICGQHCYIENNKHEYYFHNIDDIDAVEHYKNDVVAAIKSKHFAYIAHPDLFFNRISVVTPKIMEICREIVETAIEYDVPLEVNLGGLRFNNLVAEKNGCMPYPNKTFFKIASELGAKVVIGIDAHSPSDFETSDYEFANKFIKELNLNLIKDFRVK